MTSINQSDRQRYDERIRSIQNEADDREVENNKKRDDQIRRMEAAHRKEITNVQNEFQKELSGIQSANKERINQRDQELQRQIDDIKSMYRESLKKKTEDFQTSMKRSREAFDGEVNKTKQIARESGDYQVKKFENERLGKEKEFSEVTEQMHERMREGLKDSTEKLKSAHNKEKGALIADRDRIHEQNQRELQRVRNNGEELLRNEKRSHRGDNQRWENKFKEQVGQLNTSHGDVLEAHNTQLQDEIQNQRERYLSVTAKKQNEIDQAYEKDRVDFEERFEKQVRGRDYQVQELKNKLNTEKANNNSTRLSERRNLIRDYEGKLKNIETQKGKIQDNMNDLAHKRVDDVKFNGESLLRKVNREHVIERNNLVNRNREDRALLAQQTSDHIEHVEQTADERVEKMKNLTREQEKQLARYHDEAIDMAKDNFDQKLQVQRENNQNDLIRHNATLSERLRKIEGKYNTRVDILVQNYENKIAEMQHDFEKEKRSIATGYESRLSEREKGSKSELGALEMKYEAKIAEMNERHEEEVSRIHARQKEEIQKVAQKMNNFSKKA